MKNFFIVLLLLIVAGFVFVFVKPDHALSQKVFENFNIVITQEVETQEVDLTDCSSYFDGCNTCMVESGVIVGCTKMFCEEPSQPECLEERSEQTEIDLTNCISYFDGCNNCSVENGEIGVCTEMYCETPTEPKCTQYVSDTVSIENEVTEDLDTSVESN